VVAAWVVVVDRVAAQDREAVAVAAFDDEDTDADYDNLGSPFHSHSIQGEEGASPDPQD
jgi:hypothetical protein